MTRVGVAAALVAAALSGCAGGGTDRRAAPSASPSPTPSPSYDGCVPAGVEVATVTAADGVRIKGVHQGTGSTGVVLGHMTGSSACAWLPLSTKLAAAGYRVLTIDFRGYGGSDVPTGTQSPVGYDDDMIAAARWLRERGATRIVLGGASLGAMAAVVAGTRLSPGPVGVVSVSAGEEFLGLDAVGSARRLAGVPLLVVAGSQDADFTGAARTIAAAAGRRARLVILDTPLHGTDLLDFPDTSVPLEREITEFLASVAR